MEFQFECLVVKFLNKASARKYPVIKIYKTFKILYNFTKNIKK